MGHVSAPFLIAACAAGVIASLAVGLGDARASVDSREAILSVTPNILNDPMTISESLDGVEFLQPFRVTNVSNVNVDVGTPVVSPPVPRGGDDKNDAIADLNITLNTCFHVTLAPTRSCVFSVGYTIKDKDKPDAAPKNDAGVWGIVVGVPFTYNGKTGSTDGAFYHIEIFDEAPEPSSWMMMILGAGMAGAVARRRRVGFRSRGRCT